MEENEAENQYTREMENISTVEVPPSGILSLSAQRRRCRTSQLQDTTEYGTRVQNLLLNVMCCVRVSLWTVKIFLALKRRGSWVISVIYIPEECRLFGILLPSSLLLFLLLLLRSAQEAEGERFALAEGALQVGSNGSLGCAAEGLLRLFAARFSSLVCYLLVGRIVRLLLLLGIRIKSAIIQC
jgi:hypothetical protein